jgi:hypothetical protein
VPTTLEDAASALLNTLQSKGVPAEKVVLDPSYPNSLRIVLRSEAADQRNTSTDMFNSTAVDRAVFYLRRGFRGLDSYSTEIRNAKDVGISDGTTFLHDSHINSIEFIERDSMLSNEDTAAVARQRFRPEGMSVTSLDVVTDPFGYGNTQLITMTVTVADVAEANTAFPWVIGHAERLAAELNETQGTAIAVAHAVVRDQANNVLAAHVWDIELRIRSYSVSPGMDLLNHPAPTEAVATKQP